MEPVLLVILSAVCLASLAVGIVCLVKLSGKSTDNVDQKLSELKDAQQRELSAFRQEINRTTADSVKALGDMIGQNQRDFNKTLGEKIDVLDKNLIDKQSMLQKSVQDNLLGQEQRFKTFSADNEQKLDGIRETVRKQLLSIQAENGKKLDEMRGIVDEKLQKTLEERMSQSFKLVSERLEQVYKGLGEMQNLATGVGDLKKVLSNVKSRGILGEIQLGAILREILAPEQYEENVETKKSSGKRVEFAIKLPADNDKFIYLPIDSKFPGDTYAALTDAYSAGDKDQIEACAKTLVTTIRQEAKDIHDKYISPPATTDFAILFIPFEGLYAEAVNRGLVEVLQRDYKVNIAGPSTMAALLNSLQMGFKTLAIQKRSSEVWDILSAVKTEFANFEKIIDNTRKRLNQADDELEKLVGVRTRAINRKLKSVTALPDPAKSESILGLADQSIYDDNDQKDQ